MILEKDEVDVILESLRKSGYEKMAKKIQDLASSSLPSDFEYNDFPDEAPLLSIERV